jgi:hypothetical protein
MTAASSVRRGIGFFSVPSAGVSSRTSSGRLCSCRTSRTGTAAAGLAVGCGLGRVETTTTATAATQAAACGQAARRRGGQALSRYAAGNGAVPCGETTD